MQIMTFEEHVNVLEQRSYPNFGKITCSVIYGKCYLTNKEYVPSDHFYEKKLSGTFTLYPYNSIPFHIENEWLVPFLQHLYWIKNSIIPNKPRGHDLPMMFKIRRSNGSMHDALMYQEDYGIKIRKSVSQKDDFARFYARVFWINNKPVLDPSKIIEYDRDYELEMSYKDIMIDKIAEYNPEIKERGLTLTFSTVKVYHGMNDIQRKMVDYCNMKLHNWISEVVEPAIENVSPHVRIEYKLV
tara:strand:- start:6939 stop:7664 length:726 start_codon:yes stop_codon:yes gene_type:complete